MYIANLNNISEHGIILILFLAILQPRHIKAFLSHAKSGISMLAPELLKQYIQEGKLTPEGPNRILLPSSPDLEIPSPHTLITTHTSTYTHYLLSENEPVSHYIGVSI